MENQRCILKLHLYSKRLPNLFQIDFLISDLKHSIFKISTNLTFVAYRTMTQPSWLLWVSLTYSPLKKLSIYQQLKLKIALGYLQIASKQFKPKTFRVFFDLESIEVATKSIIASLLSTRVSSNTIFINFQPSHKTRFQFPKGGKNIASGVKNFSSISITKNIIDPIQIIKQLLRKLQKYQAFLKFSLFSPKLSENRAHLEMCQTTPHNAGAIQSQYWSLAS